MITEEPPVGFQVCYYDKNGLRTVPVAIAVHDGRSAEVVSSRLYQAYLSLCAGMEPSLPRNIRRLVKKSVEKPDGPEAA